MYAAKYITKVPDPVGEAARRGSVAHDTLEIMLNPRHAHHYENAILHDTCRGVPALWRVIERFASKYDVYDDKSLEMIDEFIMVAFQNDFHGVKGTYKALPEQDFELKIDRGDGRRYNIKGFIDQLFFVRDASGEWLDIKDFKTGSLFKAEKLAFPVQAMMYLLAARELYPEFKRRRFRFQFVKGKNQYVVCDVNDLQLDGFEWLLSDLQRAMDSFTMENAMDNPYHSALEGKTCWMFGKPCSFKDPVDFHALIDAEGNTLASSFDPKELTTKEGQTVQRRSWKGCPMFYNPQTGLRRNFN